MGAGTQVVILNWKGRGYVGDCIRSVLDQTYEDAGVVVVDNGSGDGSVEYIRAEFPEVQLVPLPENLHFARGTNAGVEVAIRDPKCRYVVTLNNDTKVDSEFLAALVRSVESEHVGMVAAKLLFMDRPKVLNTTGVSPTRDGAGVDRGWNQPDEGQFDAATDVFAPTAGAALYRREIFDTVGLFDGDFLAYYEDLDLAWRARLAGWEARFAPGAVVYHKYSASTTYQSAWKTYQGERNRIWTLVQNYPMRYVAAALPWNAARVTSAVQRRLRNGPTSEEDGAPKGFRGPTLQEFATAVLRAKLEAYTGMPRALEKRRLRRGYRTATAADVGRWLKTYGVPLRDMPVN
jgi:GT2 family glycosyltransferase